MPMLDEAEYSIASGLYGGAMSATKEFRLQWGIPLERATREVRFQPLLAYYEGVTGFHETNPNAVMHHRLNRMDSRSARSA